MNKSIKIILLLLVISILVSCNIYTDIPTQFNTFEITQIEEDIPASQESIEDERETPDNSYYIEEKQEENIIEERKDLNPIIPETFNLDLLEYSLRHNNTDIEEIGTNIFQIFPEIYTEMEGIITFRGNNLRNTAQYGISNIQNKKLEKSWEFITGNSTWGGGAGWTGQPVIIRWPKEVREMMNIKEEYIHNDGFTEVIYGSLDGNIYFFDLITGKQSRNHISIKNPIKGSISLDPRGYPILYVGDGINENGRFGHRGFSLIDGEELYFIRGYDPFAYRGWGAFDGSCIVNSNTDSLIFGGENGIFYNVKLNTEFDRENKTIALSPEIIKYRYKIKDNQHQGIENSVAVYRNLAFFGDNGGSIQCIDLTKMEPVWALEKSDDTDATITIEVEDGIPYLYTGTEVDKQGIKGNSIIRKINGLSGEVVWEKHYECWSILGERPNNGGALATNVIGKNDLNNMVIFTLGRYKTLNAGLMIALDKKTGEEIWKWEMPHYAWSSPVDFYNENSKGYIIQCDSIGNVHLLDGITGDILDIINLGSNIESSPAIFEDHIVIASRGGKIFGIKIE